MIIWYGHGPDYFDQSLGPGNDPKIATPWKARNRRQAYSQKKKKN